MSRFIIHQLSNFGILSNLIGSLSRDIKKVYTKSVDSIERELFGWSNSEYHLLFTSEQLSSFVLSRVNLKNLASQFASVTGEEIIQINNEAENDFRTGPYFIMHAVAILFHSAITKHFYMCITLNNSSAACIMK